MHLFLFTLFLKFQIDITKNICLFDINPSIDYLIKHFNYSNTIYYHKLHTFKLELAKKEMHICEQLLISIFSDIFLGEESIIDEIMQKYNVLYIDIAMRMKIYRVLYKVVFQKNEKSYNKLEDILQMNYLKFSKFLHTLQLNNLTKKEQLNKEINEFCGFMENTLIFTNHRNYLLCLQSYKKTVKNIFKSTIEDTKSGFIKFLRNKNRILYNENDLHFDSDGLGFGKKDNEMSNNAFENLEKNVLDLIFQQTVYEKKVWEDIVENNNKVLEKITKFKRESVSYIFSAIVILNHSSPNAILP
ncbi:hypothetical protein EDEG_03407 [Edhazardia aedis USNM 41457]|uniref:Uncharacterized protein n=1 Tax=Edhazardia aedis (strain USNM 41457) TaxID=1003232 RepID=J9D2W7_EDHAE|nr:hypothetical protein EDEG_03407 [Edhazardia aedis USNM 41457]|eukprot:EJW02151.1 hypothetical protein EDEG_03407 [Edhazardia aedis USNM 41457]